MRLICIALAALVYISAYPSVASAQDEAFKKGIQARNDKNWAEMAKQMRLAIDANGVDSATKKVKTAAFLGIGRETEYLPHFFLGEALNIQGDCAGAVSEWLISEQQKAVVAKLEYWQILQKGLTD